MKPYETFVLIHKLFNVDALYRKKLKTDSMVESNREIKKLAFETIRQAFGT